jgi:spore coat polysaccharide biosynthesis protein SpsF
VDYFRDHHQQGTNFLFMNITAIIQARMGSSRLPGKMLMDLCGYSLLHWVLARVKLSRKLTRIILATTDIKRDDPLSELASHFQISAFRGSESDVLGRFVGAAHSAPTDIVVRICADNPLIAPEEIDRLIDGYLSGLYEGRDEQRLYAFNHIPALENQYPDGLGAEILSIKLLEHLARRALLPSQREHVTSFVWDHKQDFDIVPIPAPPEIAYSKVKLDVDTPADLEKLRSLCGHLSFSSPAREIIHVYLDLFGA